jgi:lysozyme
MTFEMGISGLAVFKVFLGAMQAGNWSAAKAAMLDSVWAEEVPSRANRLAAQVITGIWQ